MCGCSVWSAGLDNPYVVPQAIVAGALGVTFLVWRRVRPPPLRVARIMAYGSAIVTTFAMLVLVSGVYVAHEFRTLCSFVLQTSSLLVLSLVIELVRRPPRIARATARSIAPLPGRTACATGDGPALARSARATP